MHERVLWWFRERVRTREYVMSVHAEEEMVADGYTIYDVERGILTGDVLERQRDRKTGEGKYRIRGRSLAEEPVELVAKRSPRGKMIILTVYKP